MRLQREESGRYYMYHFGETDTYLKVIFKGNPLGTCGDVQIQFGREA
jgi:hypothetical protein